MAEVSGGQQGAQPGGEPVMVALCGRGGGHAGAIGSPVSPRRLASARLLRVHSAIACVSLPPNAAALAWRAKWLIS
ncbi:hypothetical protein PJI22_13050 [Mycobacterium kansasii]